MLSPFKSAHKNAAVKVFPGFSSPTSNTTYAPNQFFDVCLPHSSRGVVRLVAYLIRKTLGWCDSDGNPQEEQIAVSYNELIAKAGISRQMIRQALDEAVSGNFIECVREGRPHGLNNPGQSALYQLRWDARPEYQKRIGEFAGFFEGEGNRTDIPNQFFDAVIPHEPLSVVKVVGAVIRYSIGFQAKHGRRRQHATLSYQHIGNYARIGCRIDLAKALRIALERNYLLRLADGVFSHRADERRPAVYALRWADGWNGQKNIPAPEASEIHTSNGQKSIPAEQSEKHTTIKMKPVNETYKQQADADREKAEELLKGEGFEEKTAAAIAENTPLACVANQIAWIEHRSPFKNRLGMLRKAIKEDWPEPKVGISQLSGTPGYVFAQHFYAGFAGNDATPVAEPSGRDIESGEVFVQRLLTIRSEPSRVAGWGREFGQFARQQNKPFASLQLALRQLGDRYFVRIQSEAATQKREQIEHARTAHVHQYGPAYEQYLLEEERQCQTERPEDYARFVTFRAGQRDRIMNDRAPWSRNPKWLELFDSQSQHIGQFQEFFSLPDFWKWDASINQNSFQSL